MNLRSQQIMNMAGACLGIAFHPDYKPLWLNQQPLALGVELAEADRLYKLAVTLAAQAAAAAGGASAAKAFARTELEETAFLLARALSFHFRRCNDLDRLGRVDLSRTALRRLRQQELLNQAIGIRDLAHDALDEPNAASRGVTPANIGALNSAVTTYGNIINLPRNQLVNQGALLKASNAAAAELGKRLRDITDLVIQLGHTELGARFVETWRRARRILDVSGPKGSQPSQAASTTESYPDNEKIPLSKTLSETLSTNRLAAEASAPSSRMVAPDQINLPSNRGIWKLKNHSIVNCSIPFLAGLALVLLAGCFDNRIRGDGNVVTTNLTVTNFSTLKASGAYNIQWTPGGPALTITTDSNLLQYITSKTSGDTLEIDSQENLRPTQGVTIVLSSSSLADVHLNGAMTLTASNVTGSELSLNCNGASTITVDGVVTNLQVDFSGASKLRANSLQAQNVQISMNGASTADVTASEKLDVSVNGAGTVTYGGNPKTVGKSVNGVGTIRPK